MSFITESVNVVDHVVATKCPLVLGSAVAVEQIFSGGHHTWAVFAIIGHAGNELHHYELLKLY